MLHKGIESIKRNKNVKDKLIGLSIPIANAILSKIPGGGMIAPVVTNMLQKKLDDLH